MKYAIQTYLGAVLRLTVSFLAAYTSATFAVGTQVLEARPRLAEPMEQRSEKQERVNPTEMVTLNGRSNLDEAKIGIRNRLTESLKSRFLVVSILATAEVAGENELVSQLIDLLNEAERKADGFDRVNLVSDIYNAGANNIEALKKIAEGAPRVKPREGLPSEAAWQQVIAGLNEASHGRPTVQLSPTQISDDLRVFDRLLDSSSAPILQAMREDNSNITRKVDRFTDLVLQAHFKEAGLVGSGPVNGVIMRDHHPVSQINIQIVKAEGEFVIYVAFDEKTSGMIWPGPFYYKLDSFVGTTLEFRKVIRRGDRFANTSQDRLSLDLSTGKMTVHNMRDTDIFLELEAGLPF